MVLVNQIASAQTIVPVMSITILIVTFCGNCDSSERTDTKSERSIRLDIESSYPNCIESDMNSDTNDNDNYKAKGMCYVFFSFT